MDYRRGLRAGIECELPDAEVAKVSQRAQKDSKKFKRDSEGLMRTVGVGGMVGASNNPAHE